MKKLIRIVNIFIFAFTSIWLYLWFAAWVGIFLIPNDPISIYNLETEPRSIPMFFAFLILFLLSGINLFNRKSFKTAG